MNDTKAKRYELWYSKEQHAYAFFAQDSEDARSQLEEDATLTWEVDASSWEEAQTKKHEYLGWEPYKPME